MINYEDFSKVDIRIGKIISAERIENSEKLLKLQVSFGQEQRQILSGIAKFYEPESLIGREFAFVFNLEPREMMGLESQGMILAASSESGPAILVPDREVEPGSQVK